MYFSHIRRDLEAFSPAGLSITVSETHSLESAAHLNTLHLAYGNPPVAAAAVLFAVAAVRKGETPRPPKWHTPPSPFNEPATGRYRVGCRSQPFHNELVIWERVLHLTFAVPGSIETAPRLRRAIRG